MIARALAHLTNALDAARLARTVFLLERQVDNLTILAAQEEDRADTAQAQLELAAQALDQANHRADSAHARAIAMENALATAVHAQEDAQTAYNALTERWAEVVRERERETMAKQRAESELAVVRAELASVRRDHSTALDRAYAVGTHWQEKHDQERARADALEIKLSEMATDKGETLESAAQ